MVNPQTRRFLIANVGLVAGLTLFLSLAGFAGQHHLYFDQASHFKVQYWCIALCCLPFAGLSRCRGLIAVVFATLALNGAVLAPWFLPVATPSSLDGGLTLALANVLRENQDYHRVLQWVEEIQPDIVVIQEFSEAWQQALAVWDAEFPEQILEPRENSFGIALYSKLPLEDFQVHHFSPAELPWLEASLSWNNRQVSLFSAHPLPPISSNALKLRDAQLLDLAHYIREQSQSQSAAVAADQAEPPVQILVGDLNTSPWSPLYQRLIHTTQLKNACQGFGFQPTWRTDSPLAIPIDHILVSPSMGVSACNTGFPIGSDHLPLQARLHLFPSAPA